jgi:myo-inositol-1(or 4)-monophosphatase
MLNIAIKAARAAGAIINRGTQDLDLLKITHKGPNDFVTEVDQAAEAAIIETILTAYPGHGILAEESGREHGAHDSEFTWIIDPLDGTTNYLHGFPVYCVSIALAWRGVVQQAVVYDPTRNDLFYASRGRGAFLNDKRLRVSKRTRLADSLIGTGFPFRKGDSFQRYVKMFETVMQACAGLRRPGAAALDLCYVAAGWYDGFFETGLNPWDMAAGSLIITEAGGLVGNFTGESDFLYQREVVAGNPKVYGQLVSLLAPYTKVIKQDDAAEASAAAPSVAAIASPTDALAAAVAAPAAASQADGQATPEAPAAAPERTRKPVRIRKVDAPVEAPAQDTRPPRDGERRPPRQDARGGDSRGPARSGPRPDNRGGDFRGGDRNGPPSGGGFRGGDRGPDRGPGTGERRGPVRSSGPAGAGGAPFKPRRKPGDSSY